MPPKVPDIGHRDADKELYTLSRRLHLSYRQASVRLQTKLSDYLDKFEKEDAEKRALFDSGELSYADYMAWRARKIAGSKRWNNMLNQLAEDMTNQNKIAASMINETLPEVYAINHNYGTYEAETGSGRDTTYTMYDKFTVKRLLQEGELQLPKPSLKVAKDERWNRQHIQSAVLQGILTGESMKDIAKRFQSVANMTENTAIRNARTAVTGAENAGRIDSYIRAQNMGIKMKQVWMATLDSRTRDSHAMMDGEKVDPGKKFSNGCRYPGDPEGAPGEIYNCRCTLVAEVEGADPYNPNLRPSEYLKEKGLTYEQWKEMHGERFYSELFKDEQKSERKQMVSIGKSGDSYTKEQKERISELINNAPEDIKSIWNKAQADFYKTENTEGGAHYSPLGNTVYLKTELVSNGSDSHYPYQTHFHEYGHNIDYLLSDKALEPISTLYRDDKGRSFSDIIMQEWERKFTPSRKDILEKAFILNSDIEEGGSGSFNFIRETLKDYYANDIDTYYAKVRKLREIKDDEGKLKNYFYDYIDDFAKSDNIFFDYYFVQDDIQKNLENYCEDMKSKYSLKERGDLSDMLEKYSIKHNNGAYPLGMGHGKDYWEQKDDNLSIEAFAEMFSDSVSSPEALNIIKQELPESYEAFIEIVKGAIK